MYMVVLDEEKCTGCDSCAEGCPAQILGFDGTHALIKGDSCECMGCEACVMVCPAGAFTVTEL